jgi:hypothetical protein
MADWECGGGGRRRGRGWRPPSFYPEQQFSPFNPFFFPGYGYDPFQQQGQYMPPRGPYPRGDQVRAPPPPPRSKVGSDGNRIRTSIMVLELNVRILLL